MKQDYLRKIFGRKILSVAGLSEIGVSKNVNQDAFRMGISEENNLAYIIVADGLGSCRYSDQGAERIVDIIERWILDKLPGYSYLNDSVAHTLENRILQEWNASYSPEEIYDYDTTVHAAVFYKGSILVGGIGDGMALIKIGDLVH